MAVEIVSSGDILASLKRLVQDARLGFSPGLVVHCRDAEEALTILRLPLRPDFLLLDPEIPWQGEAQVLSEIRRSRLPTKVVVIVPKLDSPQAVEIARLGPAAMISKELSPSVLIEALQRAFFPSSEASGGETEARSREESAAEAPQNDASLTRREIEVARLVSKGWHDREVADQLCVTEGTVKTHLHTIYQKLQLRGRNGLTRYCLKRRWE